jgi:hypothetical protein
VTEVVGPGSLKVVTGWSPDRSLRDALHETLHAHVAENDVRHLYGETFLALTDAEPAAIRDWLAPVLSEGESVFVVEFERWSGSGSSIDRDWLLHRGH